MNSAFTSISILVKRNIPKNCLINFLNEVSIQSLRSYLRFANIYDGNANKKKSDLIEMVIYGCMDCKLKNNTIDNVSNNNKSHSMLKEKNITIKSLPGYGNLGLKKGDIKPYIENDNCCIKIKD